MMIQIKNQMEINDNYMNKPINCNTKDLVPLSIANYGNETVIYYKDNIVCNIEELTNVRDSLTFLKKLVEDSTGIYL